MWVIVLLVARKSDYLKVGSSVGTVEGHSAQTVDTLLLKQTDAQPVVTPIQDDDWQVM